ncbi:RNA polymerase factor sigma-54 [Cryomorpha ignava]|uniref:RNA polymerase factor sigma-54 n=1 Tax=Cryomorpha ignava TaxID=101383 RepID=A0A7K3WKS2_9FLAO|nr:RNA polymerase factor sigma-54 [Cryomorpha ignava]NEN22094.1 RNA polymerase factor sigma-54 [Cryomorpha ignava]
MLKQSLQQKLLQKLSPQQIQLMKLLQVPTIELEQRIKEELEANPALDEGAEKDPDDETEQNDDQEESEKSDEKEEFDFSDYIDDDETPAYKLNINNKGSDTDEKSIPFASGTSFRDHLKEQLSWRNITDQQEMLAKTIIGNLDDDGYLRREVENISDDLAFSQNIMATTEELEEALRIVQHLDPAGVGARDLRECLMLQLARKDNTYPSVRIATEILDKYFEAFTKKHYDRITKRMEVDNEDLKVAISEIVKLNPKPGNSMRDSSKTIQHVVPDFVITTDDEDLLLSINGRNAPDLRISDSYKHMIKGYEQAPSKDKKQKEAVMFVKQKIDSARWFIDAIKQRQQTLLLTMNAIMEFQKEYFITGDETKLRPMILKDIAEIVHLDISTISRVANSKYVQTPYGTFLLKTFFSESLTTDTGEEVSTREVKKILQDAVDGESKKKPLTDEKLANLLKDKGYQIARRTVAKYREQLNISVARLRKQL